MSSLYELQQLKQYNPVALQSAEDHAALLLTREDGCVLLTSQYGSTVRLQPFHKTVCYDPQSAVQRTLAGQGLKPVELPEGSFWSALSSFMCNAGFSLSQVQQVEQLAFH